MPLGGWVSLSGYVLLPLAWWWYRKGMAHAALVVLVLCTGLLRLGPALDSDLHQWDERYHALVAKQLLIDPLKPTLYPAQELPHEQGSWTAGHVWVNKPPLSLWCMAGALKLFGTKAWVVRLPSVLLSMFGAALLFGVAGQWTSARGAFWATLLFAIQGHLIELASGRTSNDHPDTFLVVFTLAAIHAASRISATRTLLWPVLCGVLLGCAFLSKSWPALLVLPVAGLLLFARGDRSLRINLRTLAVIVFSSAIIALPWYVFASRSFPAEMAIASKAHWGHFTNDIEGHGRTWLYFWEQIPLIHGALAVFAMAWFLLGPFRKSPLKFAALVTWALLPYLIFSFARTKMPGYIALSVPAWCIIMGIAVDSWWRNAASLGWERRGQQFAAVVLVAFPLHISWLRTRPLAPDVPRYTIDDRFRIVGPGTVVFGSPYPIELMFHTDVSAAYAWVVQEVEKKRLSDLRYVVFVDE